MYYVKTIIAMGGSKITFAATGSSMGQDITFHP